MFARRPVSTIIYSLPRINRGIARHKIFHSQSQPIHRVAWNLSIRMMRERERERERERDKAQALYSRNECMDVTRNARALAVGSERAPFICTIVQHEPPPPPPRLSILQNRICMSMRVRRRHCLSTHVIPRALLYFLVWPHIIIRSRPCISFKLRNYTSNDEILLRCFNRDSRKLKDPSSPNEAANFECNF